jgi:hypothetical protein
VRHLTSSSEPQDLRWRSAAVGGGWIGERSVRERGAHPKAAFVEPYACPYNALRFCCGARRPRHGT